MSGNLTYKQSGVDTIEAQSFVSDISSHVKRTQKNRQLCNAFGLFAAAYDLSSYKEGDDSILYFKDSATVLFAQDDFWQTVVPALQHEPVFI